MADQRPGELDDALLARLLPRYLAGDVTPDERAAIERQLTASPAAARVLARYLDGLDGAANRPPAPDVDASWAALRARMRDAARPDVTPAGVPNAAPDATPHHTPDRQRAFALMPRRDERRSWPRWVASACAAAALVAVAYEGGALRRPVAPAPVAAPRVYTTAARQRADVRMPDGTVITLAPGSRLRVATDFGVERRDVYLEGEAFFDVAHDARRPFTVFAGNASAHDIGTAFAVRSFSEERAVQVVVRSGIVALSGVGRLNGGDVGRLAADGRATLTRNADVAALLGWMDGRLVFRDAPLGVVLRDVRRWYGADVRLADSSLALLPFTGTLTEAAPSQAVSVVAATLGLGVTRSGDAWVLSAVRGRTPTRRHAVDVRPDTTAAPTALATNVVMPNERVPDEKAPDAKAPDAKAPDAKAPDAAAGAPPIAPPARP